MGKDGVALNSMHTVRGLIALLKVGELSVDEVAEKFTLLDWRPDPPATTIAESYRRAEDMPDDNDIFWIDAAFTQSVITYEDCKELTDALVVYSAPDQERPKKPPVARHQLGTGRRRKAL